MRGSRSRDTEGRTLSRSEAFVDSRRRVLCTSQRRVPRVPSGSMSQKVITPPTKVETRWLIVIGIIKLLKAAFLIAFAFAALGLLHHDITVECYRLAEFIHVDPENRFLDFVIQKVGGMNDTSIRHLSEFIFAYAAIYMTEGIGLLLRKRWAEWMTTIVTASFIPIELWHLWLHPSWGKVIVITLNVLILIYLIRVLRHTTHRIPSPEPRGPDAVTG